ncbi:hypothetical protein B5F27_11145 [Faecalibacterium sp. An192]|nr:hypothetical protein B5F27_11145 [Faecalibacterium sp. An192]
MCQTGRAIFSLLLTTDKNQKCQTPGQENFSLTYYYNLNRAKWPGMEQGNKKAVNLFQTYCFRWPPVGGWYSVVGLIGQSET